MAEKEKWYDKLSPRGMVLGILGAVTVGVAILSMAVSYQILDPQFGIWAVPTVGALDALWVVFQATEILSGNNRRRARRVQVAGLALTAVNAAIPTFNLILSGSGGFDLAMVLTPIAIVATKTAWWIALPSLGRKVSDTTRQKLDAKRQTVMDRLEEMEAEAAHRIELLEVATTLEQQVAKAETTYRRSALKAQQAMTKKLHRQAEATARTVQEKPLPMSVARIVLPELDEWEPAAPALPVTVVPELVTQVSEPDRDAEAEASHHERLFVTVEEIAAVTGVPTPVAGEQLTDDQIGVVLRALRYAEDPPMSYRKASEAYRRAGFVGSERKIRLVWRELKTEAGEAEEAEEAEESEDADARH
ncbi:hypothetical protein ACFWOJ_37555 [Streptomyces sp. NPDC058439]|uniref:hypothetical protein n=1 Tax=Streptomyces sp. NPDC058439 TaxID=3346500 RepID=UPI003662E963